MAYLIIYTGKFADLKITPNATELPMLTGDEQALLIANESDLYKAVPSGPDLAALYNAVGGNDLILKVKRFKDRVDGAKRTYGMISRLYPEVPEAAAPSTTFFPSAATTPEEGDMTKKTKKAKVAKAPKAKKARTPKERKGYSTEVKSSGGAESKAKALELIQRAKGATPAEIAEKLGVSTGTAKNLIWYLRRDGKKIVFGEKSGDRRPYVIG